TISMAVDLPHDLRGTHMSRFVECLQTLGAVSPLALEAILDTLKSRLQAEKAMLEMEFTYFISKEAPVTKQKAPLDLTCRYRAEKGEKFELYVCAEIPIHTLCPCSREISSYGAHNQRALAIIEMKSTEMVWLEELALMAEAGASAPIYALLKRPDEKFVTEQAYENPRFVEDAVREIALQLEQDQRINWYQVTVESMESIHNHNAFACVEKGWGDEKQ
ncbi:MAG: GTP cyclohydrolase FolE2, partial [Acidaminococcaceae bacterium]